jgi:hypothetical protein
LFLGRIEDHFFKEDIVTSQTQDPVQLKPDSSAVQALARGVLRLLKIVGFTVVGFALLVAGIIWLVEGITSEQPLSIGGGALAITVLAGWVLRTILRSRREARSQIDQAEAKRISGQWTCAACTIDFAEATSVKTPEAWYHTAIGVTLALIPIGMGSVGLWALGFSSDHSIKLFFLVIVSVALLFLALKGRSRLYVRCPKCGRSCGWIDKTFVSG